MNSQEMDRFAKMQREAERLLELVNADPCLKEEKAPKAVKEHVWKKLRRREEEQELIQLGRVYKKKRSLRKYWLLAAAMVMALAFGVTSLGGAEKIFGYFDGHLLEKKQLHLDSNENIVPIYTMTEMQVYDKIEEKYGISPVRIHFRPEGVEFASVNMADPVMMTSMDYRRGDYVAITYSIRPNFQDSTYSCVIDGELLETYEITIDDTVLTVSEYNLSEDDPCWVVQFTYEDVYYYMTLLQMEESEVKQVIEDLYFPT